MAKQIKLRRDQQKAKKAQEAVEIIEQSVRESVNLDLSPKMTLKSPLKGGNKKTKAPRQKPTKLMQQQSTDPTQLLKMQFEARQSAESNDQDENKQNRAPVMPRPIHPMFFRHLRAHNR
jgi:hypothetical protein